MHVNNTGIGCICHIQAKVNAETKKTARGAPHTALMARGLFAVFCKRGCFSPTLPACPGRRCASTSAKPCHVLAFLASAPNASKQGSASRGSQLLQLRGF